MAIKILSLKKRGIKILNNLNQNYEDDKLHEECGVFGVYNHPDAAALTALGLHALQHRGQEAAGIVTFDGDKFLSEKHLGLVSDHFSKPSVINRLQGRNSVGHNRYSTTGGTVHRNIQPHHTRVIINLFDLHDWFF